MKLPRAAKEAIDAAISDGRATETGRVKMPSEENPTMICPDCGNSCKRVAAVQLYCPDCSHIRDMKRKKLWARKHPLSREKKERRNELQTARKVESRLAGMVANKEQTMSIIWDGRSGPDLLWQIRVSVPFTYATSKNHIYAMRAQGHVAMRKESVAAREEISLRIKEAVGGVKIVHNKVWLDILVQKPNHKGDAVNVVDLVCDAVKKAIPVDDRWYCIRRLDWQIVKENPRLFIAIGQESDEDCQVCCYCGQIKPFADFNRKSGSHKGIGRECRSCCREGRKMRVV